MQTWPLLQSILLLTLANGAPVVAKKVLGARLAFPLDAGARFFDGQPLLGPSKTVRGVVISVVTTAVVAPLLGLSLAAGGLVAALAMTGDLFSSFVKRRLKFPSSSQAIGLDQVPESLLPLLVCKEALSLTSLDVAIGVCIFVLGELILSRLLYGLRLRDEPY
ncbi:CDP-archaeol synthase [Bradyrhizobium sp.]|uniref:CDP-archaeol synthase n=1 Tax=Bradyrhizobium sp. TaxID=376 RepID=UPI003C71542F